MYSRVAVRAFNQYRTHCVTSVRGKTWFSGSSDSESLKSSVTVGANSIKYICSGEGDHAVLCLPGPLGSSETDFISQIEGLDKKAFTVIAWDPPGYGHSRPPSRNFDPGFLNRDADQAIDFMKAIGIDKFSVLGWSDGGITGIFLAAKYPENLRKMAIWGSSVYITDKEVEIYKKIQAVNIWSERMKAQIIELYGEDDFQIMWKRRVDELLRIHREDGGDICKTKLKSIQCPLFVLHGNKDPLIRAEHPKYIIGKVPGSQLYTFEDGNHHIHSQYPEEFNSLVHKFLTSDHSSATSHHFLPVRLPPFLSKSPGIWFAQIEALFHISHVNDDLTKFNCVILQLDTKYSVLVEDVICDPPADGKYNLLKTEIIKRLKEERLKEPLRNAEIGEKKPSEFLNHLRELAGNNVSDSELCSFWLRGLSKQVQSIVTTKSTSLDSMAELADKVAEMQRVPTKSLPQAPSQKLKKPAAPPETETAKISFSVLEVPKYDVLGWPQPGSISLDSILRDIHAKCNYRSLLTEFPGILNPSEAPQEVHRRTSHRILTSTSSPVVSRSSSLNDTKRSGVASRIISSMMRQGTARPSSSPYGSTLRVIKPQEVDECNDWQVFCDYRLLNKNTVSDVYRIRHPVSISDALWGCNIFSVVYLRKDWTRIPVAPDDIAKTAVNTSFGKFEFPFMPLGLLNCTTTWQKVLDEVLQGLPNCFGYLDGILVFSRNDEDHLQHIRALFQRLSMDGIFVNASTSVFGEPCVDFFNYSISSSGFTPIREKFVKAIEDIRSPKTYADVERFLSMNKSYRRYIPESLEGPLTAVIEGSAIDWDSPVPWTLHCEKAFQDCKSALIRATLHSNPDSYTPLSMFVTVHGCAVGAALNQETPQCAVPLAFFSKELPKAESTSSVLRYLTAVYESVEAFRPVLGGRIFTLFVDLGLGGSYLEHFETLDKFYFARHVSQFTPTVRWTDSNAIAAAHCLAASIDPTQLSTESTYYDISSTGCSDETNNILQFSRII